MVGTKYKVETKVVTIDVASPQSRAAGCVELEKLSHHIDIGVLGRLNP